MNNLSLFLKTARIPNLLMLAFVQLIVLVNFVQQFTWVLYAMTAASTLLIALGAYLLNDVEDVPIDKENNKLKWVNTENLPQARRLAIGTIALGLLLGLILSFQTKLSLFFFYFMASTILVAYAYTLSKYKFVGNLLISMVIALAILLSFYLGVNHGFFTRKFYGFNELGVWIYAGIAFLLNWIREIVKDMEDMRGDQLVGRKSLPLSLGVKLSKGIVLSTMLFFMVIFSLWLVKNTGLTLRVYLVLLIALNLAAMIQLYRSQQAKDFNCTSLLIKLLMLLGLLVPFSEIL